jgi:hypothetical protein
MEKSIFYQLINSNQSWTSNNEPLEGLIFSRLVEALISNDNYIFLG